MHTRITKRQTWHRYSNHFICSIPALSVLFFFVNDTVCCRFFFFYQKVMSENVKMQRTQPFSRFFFVTKRTKEPSDMQCMHMVFSSKISILEDQSIKGFRKMVNVMRHRNQKLCSAPLRDSLLFDCMFLSRVKSS